MLPLLLLCTLFAPADAPTNLVVNGGFDRTRGWQLGGARIVAGEHGRWLRSDGGGASQEVPAPQARHVAVAVDLRCGGVQPQGGAGYAYAAVYQLDATGELVAFRDFIQLTGDHPWQRHGAVLEVDPRAATLSLRCGLFQAKGWLEVDNWTLVPGDQPAAWDAVQQPGKASASHRVAILNVPGLPVTGTGSSPQVLAGLLTGAGFEVDLLDDRAWADPTVLQPARYGLAVVPTGASFPALARDNWRRYLRGGGSFVSTGGYAFDELLVRDGTGWVDESVKIQRDLTAACSPERSLLPDGGFEQISQWPVGEQSVDGQWHARSNHPKRVETQPLTGQWCAEVDVPTERGEGEDGLSLELPAERGLYRVMAGVRAEGIAGRGFAYAALYQYGADGKLLAWRDFAQVRGTTDWQRYTYDFSPAAGVQRIHLKLGLYRAAGRAWFDDCRLSRITGLQPSPINTSTGEPRDGLVVGPERIGVFDPSAPLQRVTRLQTALGQHVVDAKLDLEGDFTGWQATGVLGRNNARWIPLLEAVDRYGRPRGAAAAMMLNTGGFYGGSCWAYFGVDNQDLFARPDSPAGAALVGAAKFIADGIYLRDLRCEHRYQRPGRDLTVTVGIEARDELPAGLRVKFGGPGRGPLPEVKVPSARPLAEVSCELRELPPGTHRVIATLYRGDQPIDTLTTGVMVSDPQPPGHGDDALYFRANSFEVNHRPLFLFGADTYSDTYKSAHENPWTWHNDHLAARDFGLNLYENLQYNNPDHKLTEDDWESFLGMAQSTHETGLVFMPGMLIGHNVVVDDAELQRQRDHCADYAKHLHDLPQLLYYINGDYQLRPDEKPAVTTQLWDRYLRQKYGSVAGVEQVWGKGRVTLDGKLIAWPPASNQEWDDQITIDAAEFKLWLMRRWNEANVKAVREHDRVHPITSEYYSLPFGGMDQRLTIDGQDVSNIGYFDEPEQDLDRLPLRLSWNDLRARGKGVSLGEYGVKTHPAWAGENGGRGYHIQRTEAQRQQLFLTIAAYTFGLGGSKVQTWCLRDAQDRVFPWGIFYPNQLIPKDVAYVHRNLSLLWRTLAPASEAPAVTVCLPSRMRIGHGEVQARDAGYRCFESLHELHVPFNVIDDTALDTIPAATRAVLLPSAAALAEDEVDRLTAWVAAGGHLLLTGDPGWDARRRPAAPARYEKLCGVKLVKHLAPPGQRGPTVVQANGLPWQPAAQVAAGDAAILLGEPSLPVLCRYPLGRGEVFYLTDPIELSPVGEPSSSQEAVYHQFLTAAGAPALRVSPDRPELRVASRQTARGRFWMLFDHRAGNDHREATLDGRIHLGYRPRWPAVMQIGEDGGARLVVSEHGAKLGDTVLWSGQGLQGLAALDGLDLQHTRRLLLTPFDTGTITWPAQPGRWVALVGDVRDGQWVVYERLRLGGKPSLTVDEDRRFCLILVVPAGEEEAGGRRLEQWLVSPWSMPGN